jgi:hypothetical protein
MTDARSYDVFLTKPAAGSKYEFLLFGFALSHEAPPLWASPIEITDDLAPGDARYWRRWNEQQVRYDATLKNGAVQRLREAGMPENLVREPLSDQVSRLVGELMADTRRALLQLELRSDPIRPAFDISSGTYERSLCTRVVLTAHLSLKGRGPAKVAAFLNEGRASNAKGLTRYHIGRAVKAQQKRWLQLGSTSGPAARAVPSIIAADRALLASLNFVHEEARKRDEFRRLNGAELAAAIHSDRGLHECVRRADEILARAA